MVDLRDALRPFVDEAAAGPRRPVAEVAERAAQARRRRLRRRTAVTGLAVAVVAVAAVASTVGSRHPADDVSTVDASPSTSSAPAPAPAPTDAPETTAHDAGPTTAPPTTAPSTTSTTTAHALLVSLVDGVVATSTTTSSWESGYCVEIRVENTTAAPVEWKVRDSLDGTIATLWSAVADARSGDVTFTGEAGYNRQLAAGASTTFGTCVDR